MTELKLPEPDTHCLDDEGGRPIDVWSYSPELVREIVAADRAQRDARHAEELLAYELTVANLRALHKSIEPEATAISEAVESFHGTKERGWNSGDLIASMMRDGAGS